MNWTSCRPRKLWIACLMLMLCAMCWAAQPETETPMLVPPPNLQNFLVLESGARVLYFDESGWIEFSALVQAWAQGVVEESVAVAVKPLLVENAGLKAEVAALRKPRRGTLLWIVGVGAAGLVTGLVVGVAISK